MLGMLGIECIATTWDGKRIHLNSMNEWGGFLTVDEAADWAKKELVNYTQARKYEKIEIITKDGVQKTLDSLILIEEAMGKEVANRYRGGF
jgi:hypothetical protein